MTSTFIICVIVLFAIIIDSIAGVSIKLLSPISENNLRNNIQWTFEFSFFSSFICLIFISCQCAINVGLPFYDMVGLYHKIKVNKTLIKLAFLYSFIDTLAASIFYYLLIIINGSKTLVAIKMLYIILTFIWIRLYEKYMMVNTKLSCHKIIKLCVSYIFMIIGTFLLTIDQKWSNIASILFSFLVPILVSFRDTVRHIMETKNTNNVSPQIINTYLSIGFTTFSMICWILSEIIVNYRFGVKLPFDKNNFHIALSSLMIAGFGFWISSYIIHYSIHNNTGSVFIVGILRCTSVFWYFIIDIIVYNVYVSYITIIALILLLLGNVIIAIKWKNICRKSIVRTNV